MDEDRVVLGDLIATPMRARGERPGGRRYWRIRLRGDGTRETIQTGWWTREEAVAAVATAALRPRTSRSAPEAAVERTVGDLCRLWRDAQVRRHEAGDLSACSIEIYRNVVRRWLGTSLVELGLSRLTRVRVSDQAIAWRADRVSARVVDYNCRLLQQVVRWGAERELCDAVDLRIPRSTRLDEYVYCARVPSREEVVRVLDAMPQSPYRSATEILSLTGARCGEVVALRVGDVTSAGLRLSGRDVQRGRRGKTAPRLFPLSGRLERLVGELARGRDPAAPLLDLPATGARRIQDRLAWASDRAGVERVTPHGIRRLVVSELLEVTDPRTAGELTGHSVTILLRHYVRPRAEQLQAVVERAKLGNVVPIGRRAQRARKGGDE